MVAEAKDRFRALKHPLFLLIVGSTIGSFLVPWINREADRNRAWQEARLKRQLEIANNNTITMRQLESLVTHLKRFHDDNIRLKPTPAKLIELQKKLAIDMNASYAEFEKNGWWWPRSVSDEAVILQIVPPGGSDKLRNDVDAYLDNIRKAVSAIHYLWRVCLSKEYDFEADGKVTTIQTRMDQRLNQLASERIDLIKNWFQNFSTQQ